MQVSDYIEIVKSTDQFSGYDLKKRRQISLYGLVGEIGSLTSAVKKAMLAGYANPSNDEVVEEIGDVFWYLFNLITILGIEQTPNVLKKDIVHVRKEVTDASERGEEMRWTPFFGQPGSRIKVDSLWLICCPVLLVLGVP